MVRIQILFKFIFYVYHILTFLSNSICQFETHNNKTMMWENVLLMKHWKIPWQQSEAQKRGRRPRRGRQAKRARVANSCLNNIGEHTSANNVRKAREKLWVRIKDGLFGFCCRECKVYIKSLMKSERERERPSVCDNLFPFPNSF